MTRAVTTDRFVAGARIGDYVVDRELALDDRSEAVGSVYAATHVVLPRQAQIQVAAPGSREAAIQLLREACLLEALSHRGIPRVYECGVLGERRAWSAIELVDGVPFERFVGAGPLAVADLVVALRDVADILRHAHERGVVHRRLSARAIRHSSTRRGSYLVSGWADARTIDADADVAVDPRDDVYALGRIAFRALTGVAPEPVPSLVPSQGPRRPPSQPLGRAGTEPFVPVRSAALCSPAAPAELVALIDLMLAEPAGRPTSHDVHDRALWLCDTLDLLPLLDRPRWTPPQGIVQDGVAVGDSAAFSIRITR
jgi:hypothetical protein